MPKIQNLKFLNSSYNFGRGPFSTKNNNKTTTFAYICGCAFLVTSIPDLLGGTWCTRTYNKILL